MSKRLRRFEEIDFFGKKYQNKKFAQSPRMEQTSYTNIWDVTPSRERSEVRPAIINSKSPAPS
jgi:hypothetical protein